MTVTPVVLTNPLTMKDCLVQFGATDSYEQAVTQVTLTPTASIISQAAVSPGAVYQDVSQATWGCTMSFMQDWGDEDSLGRYLFDNEGDSVVLTFQPKTGDASITVTVIVTPGAIGGSVGAYAIASVTLPCVGKPEFA